MQLLDTLTKVFCAAYAADRPLKERLGGAFDLLRYGFVDNAREVVAELKKVKPGARVDWLEKLCQRAEIYHRGRFETKVAVESVPVEGLPEPIRIRRPTDVMILHAPDPVQIVISFGGANSAFWVPTPLINLPKTNVIALRDARRLFHLAGVIGLGVDYAETVAGLKKLAKELGGKKVVAVGCSSGGYSALRYALDLNLPGVLAISAMTRINADESELQRYPALRKIARTQPGVMQDLVPLYQKHPNPPKAILAWGDQNPLDTEQALRMKGLPNVTLEPVASVAAHAAWLKLGAEQALDSLVGRVFAA